MKNGYSGRSFDTKYITPFLKMKNFKAAMRESGWLTRSLEQPEPYDLKYPGSISGKDIKNSFLNILDYVERKKVDPKSCLILLFYFSISNIKNKEVKLINPINKESEYTINDIILLLKTHFNYKYESRGASKLPVIALYSIYQILVNELKRFENKNLKKLSSHISSDKSSGNAGDIIVTSIMNHMKY